MRIARSVIPSVALRVADNIGAKGSVVRDPIGQVHKLLIFNNLISRQRLWQGSGSVELRVRPRLLGAWLMASRSPRSPSPTSNESCSIPLTPTHSSIGSERLRTTTADNPAASGRSGEVISFESIFPSCQVSEQGRPIRRMGRQSHGEPEAILASYANPTRDEGEGRRKR